MSEPRYRVKNRFTGKEFLIPLGDAEFYANARHDANGERMFEFLSDLPGVVVGTDGSQQTLVPKERVHEAYHPDSPFYVLRSEKDPAWEMARQSAAAKAKQQVAEERSGLSVMADAALSVPTFGASSKLANAIAGEGAAEARARSIAAHGLPHFAGQAAGLVLLGGMPLPFLGAARGVQTGLRAGSVFEVGAAVSSKIRSSIGGKGIAAEFGRRFLGPVAFGATVDAPLSAALVAADIVDRDKDYTAQSVAADFFTQYLLSVGLAAVTSVPFAALGAAASKASTTSFGKDVVRSGAVGAIRNFWRPKRGRLGGLTDAGESLSYKMVDRYTKRTARSASETKMAKLLAPSLGDDFARLNATWGEVIDGIRNGATVGKVRSSVRAAMNNVRDADVLADLALVERNAAMLIDGRRKAQDLIAGITTFAERFLNTPYRHPPKAVTGVVKPRVNELRKFVKARYDVPNLSKDYNALLDDVLNLRRTLPTGKQRNTLDEFITGAFPRMAGRTDEGQPYLALLTDADNAANDMLTAARKFGETGYGLERIADLIEEPASGIRSLRAEYGKFRGTFKKLTNKKISMMDEAPFMRGPNPLYKQVGKEKHFTIDTKLDDLRPGVEAFAAANRVVNKLLHDADRINILPLKNVTSNEDFLAAQVDNVMTVKQRIKSTLGWIALRGGGARHTATFGGVFLFRNMASAAEKRASFTAVHDAVLAHAATPEQVVAHIGHQVDPVARQDLGLGTALAGVGITALSYLGQQLPRSTDARIGPEHFSMSEIENFLEIVGALSDPISVLAASKNGSITDQSVDAIRTVYPDLYAEMVLDVAEFVDEYGDKLDYPAWVGLDAFTGYALGVSDGPAPDLTLQPPYAQTAEQAVSIGATGPQSRQMGYQQGTTPAQKVGGM